MAQSLMTILGILAITSTVHSAPAPNGILIRDHSSRLCVVMKNSQATVYYNRDGMGIDRILGPIQVAIEVKNNQQVISSSDKKFLFFKDAPGISSQNVLRMDQDDGTTSTFDYIVSAQQCPFSIEGVR